MCRATASQIIFSSQGNCTLLSQPVCNHALLQSHQMQYKTTWTVIDPFPSLFFCNCYNNGHGRCRLQAPAASVRQHNTRWGERQHCYISAGMHKYKFHTMHMLLSNKKRLSALLENINLSSGSPYTSTCQTVTFWKPSSNTFRWATFNLILAINWSQPINNYFQGKP